MSDFGKPQPCRNYCGAYIYFDKDSEIGHPSSDKWIPLVYENNTGLRTNSPHHCPNSPYSKTQQQQQGQGQLKPQPKMSGNMTEQPSSTEYERSVDDGISAFSMMTDLIRLVEQTQKLLVSMDGKIDRLLNLTFAQEQKK